MIGVTYSEKRYIAVCQGCDRLFDAVRRDKLTCSPACRVFAHRSGRVRKLRALAASFEVTPASVCHHMAIDRLGPDLAGKDNLDEVMPEVCAAFDKLVWAIVRGGDAA